MKRENGSGSVEERADGRARGRVMVDGRRRTIGTFPSEDAERMRRAWNTERDDGAIVASSTVTLAAYGAEWLDRRELHGSRRRETVRSIGGERSAWSRHVASSALARMPLTAIRPRDVEALAFELRGRKALHAVTRGRGSNKMIEVVETSRPLSRAMQREALRLVRACLDDAMRRDLIARNPADGVCAAPGSVAPRDLGEAWLRQPEIDTLLACEKISARDRAAYACAIGLALRLDDLKAIELEHVHLDAEIPGPHIAVFVAKSRKHHRVPIMPWLAPWIRAHIATLPHGTRWLFPTPDGERYARGYDFSWAEDRERKCKRVPSALERAGIKRRIRFHDLRGTCATHLALGTWGRTWSLHEIQGMLAHSDQRVTERYVRRAVDALAGAARDTPGCPTLPQRATGTNGATTENERAPRVGLEPTTIRLTAGRSTN